MLFSALDAPSGFYSLNIELDGRKLKVDKHWLQVTSNNLWHVTEWIFNDWFTEVLNK